MDKELQKYLRWHRANGHSPKTILWHSQTLGAFTAFLAGHGYSTDVEDLHVDFVREWVQEQRDRELSDHTIATRVRSIRAFTNWLVEEEYLSRNPLRRLKLPKAEDIPKTLLTPEHIDALLS